MPDQAPQTPNHYFCCACHGTPDDHCDECKHLCQPTSKTELDALQEQLRAIVTRNGKSGRIPELLEAELADLTTLIAQREQAAERRGRIDEWLLIDKVVDFSKKRSRFVYNVYLPLQFVRKRVAELQATKPEKGE